MKNRIFRIFRTYEEFKANNDLFYNTGVAMGMQLGFDLAHIALGRKSKNFREKWFTEYFPRLREVIDDYGDKMDADVEIDKDMWDSTNTLDKELESYLGSNFKPWQERYFGKEMPKTK